MFLLIVIVILIAATSILANIYGGIFSFQQNYGDLENYSNSHYATVSAIERGLLVTKYKKPSFVGSGGFIGTGNWGEISELFSGSFGDLNKNNNGLYWEITSQCDTIKGNLKQQNTLTISTYTYSNTPGHYEYDDEAITTKGISNTGGLSGTINNLNENIIITDGNIYRQINGDDELAGYTGFVTSSGDTKINSGIINLDTAILTFNNNTIDPSSESPVGNTLCTQDGCYTGSTISNLITHDKGILFYIQDRLTDNNNNQIGEVKYAFTNNFSGNCQNYSIDGTAIIGKYKQKLSVEKPTFNYRNPNRKKFIFPHYN